VSTYLDASVLLPFLIDEPTSTEIARYLTTQPERLVSDFAAAEVSSALSRMIRMRTLSHADASIRLADFDAWRAAACTPVELQPADGRLADAYVRRFELGLRAPDALHLAIARRLDATLVTLDRRMARAAEDLGVTTVVPATS
jgi:predicted nucleic acid-binding protein